MKAWPRKPWQTDLPPAAVYQASGMLGEEERQALYWIAKNSYRGRGAIVDAGAFLGASALCLSAGAAQSGKIRSGRPTVYSFDYFSAIDDYVTEFISQEVRSIQPGESYLDIFEAQTAEYRGLIQARPGDFLNERWSNDPIEILFIDIAKTQELNSHLVAEFFPHLIVGESIVIQQDFYHLWHPYIHITMEYLSDYFELLDDYVAHQSRIYRYKRPIPTERLRRVVDYNFDPEERRSLLRQAAAGSNAPVQEMLEAILVYQCALDKDAAAFDSELEAFEERHPDFRTNWNLWAREMTRIEQQRQALFG